jgi:hypothetical protein
LVLVVQFAAAAAVQRVGKPIIDGAFGVSVRCLVTLPAPAPGNHHSKNRGRGSVFHGPVVTNFILGLSEYRFTRCNFSMVRHGMRERERKRDF